MTSVKSRPCRKTYHEHAYRFVFAALRLTQDRLGRNRENEESGHISGRELLEGVRILGQKEFGMLASQVLKHWGITATDDIGRIVFELIESGDMRKTDQDRLSDFFAVYDFNKVFVEDYQVNIKEIFC